MQINLSGIPILPPEPPPLTSDITAKDVMNTKVVAFPSLVTVDFVLDVLAKVSHQGFPVVKEFTEIVIHFSTLMNAIKLPLHDQCSDFRKTLSVK